MIYHIAYDELVVEASFITSYLSNPWTLVSAPDEMFYGMAIPLSIAKPSNQEIQEKYENPKLKPSQPKECNQYCYHLVISLGYEENPKVMVVSVILRLKLCTTLEY